MEFSLERMIGYLPELLPAAGVTIGFSLASMVLATVLGLLFATMSSSPVRLVRTTGRVYIEVTRTVPELVQLYLWFYMLPEVGIVLIPPVAGFLALGNSFGGYLAEVFRGGIEAVDRTQWEAGKVLGMRRSLVWRRVVLPQAAINVLPIWTSYFVSMFKATAYLSIITVPELMHVSLVIAAANFRFFELFALAGLFYFAMGYPAIVFLRRFERRWTRVLRPPQTATRVEIAPQRA